MQMSRHIRGAIQISYFARGATQMSRHVRGTIQMSCQSYYSLHECHIKSEVKFQPCIRYNTDVMSCTYTHTSVILSDKFLYYFYKLVDCKVIFTPPTCTLLPISYSNAQHIPFRSLGILYVSCSFDFQLLTNICHSGSVQQLCFRTNFSLYCNFADYSCTWSQLFQLTNPSQPGFCFL